MSELLSKNGLPIRRGVSIIVGPGHPNESPFWVYTVVRLINGRVDLLDPNNNIATMDEADAELCWVVTSSLRLVDEFKGRFEKGWLRFDEERVYLSEICAGLHDRRF